MNKIIKLTPEQDTRWGQLFSLAVNSGKTDLQADKEAWEGLFREEWPELKKFDLAKIV